MDGTQNPLSEGLLTALVSSVAPSPTSTPYTVPSAYDYAPSSTPDPGYHGSSGSRGRMHEWSSLIGISTALAGNVLISLALNIQRYAHIRIDREWTREKIREEANWKRAHSTRAAAGSYGTVSEGVHARGNIRIGRDSDAGRYRDESPRGGHAQDESPSRRVGQSTNIRDERNDPLRQSSLSDQTIRPGNKEKNPHYCSRRKSYLRSPYWWVGFVLMCLGEVGNFLAYGFAPASIVSPLGVVAMISNCVIAPFMLKEKFRTRDLWGVFIAIAGAVVVVLSAKSSEEKIGPHDIWVMITRWEFELYLGITAALTIALMWVSSKYGSQSILIDVGLVALFGGYTALSTKGVSSILSFTLWHIITFPVSYLLGFVLVSSALMQIRYINRALQRFDSTQVIPTQFVLFTLSVIIGSAVLYRDFASFTPARAGKFVGGCLLTFLGVYFITSGRVRADDESTFSVDDEEEAIGLLAGDQYRDSVDISPSRRESQAYQPSRKTSRSRGDEEQSPSGSLLSRGIEDISEGLPTPKGILSAVPSSPRGSLAAESLRAPSPQQSPQLPPNSLITDPWAEFQEQLVYTPKSEPPLRRSVTPPGRSSDMTPSSAVVLRFPSAPGVDDNSPQHRRTSGTGHAHLGTSLSSRSRMAQMASPRRMRNSISKHFSPGALLPTLSGGFSAVVAQSLRRGESSPSRERTPKRQSGRRKRLSTSIMDGNSHGGVDDTDASVEDGQESPLTARLRSTGNLPSAPVTTAQLTSALAARTRTRDSDARDDITSLKHLRSFSDSWSGRFPGFGGALHRSRGGPKGSSADQGDTGDHDAEAHGSEGVEDAP